MDIFISEQSCSVLCMRGLEIVSYQTFSNLEDFNDAYEYFNSVNITPGKDTSIFVNGLIYYIIWEKKELGFYNTQKGKIGKIKSNRD